ncbi:hypothetical protein [Pseudomonas aeruginosa]|uniref:hypothetical protein n=1 Tax=Pseudomonas aeruginosa TaxID=287 RepID=UPI00114257BA|nr:hypothetical protein [Pseudomonas aeruginosa]MCS8245828.1 hypothetical protein [Pseudomonas aeruginosa]MDU0780770.1 hypothetical protein [Pseudomonas aeruginosa]HEJ1294567.1 hypothetical protein [Pseudomonas aeruginosa]HEJ1943531.1 hypothetical protein [Pseudomonas aeruginosa]
MPSEEAIRALRTLLLPIIPADDREKICAKELEDYLIGQGVLKDDFNDWAIISLESWAESNAPSDQLKAAIQKILLKAGDSSPGALSQQYFSIHQKLQGEHFFSHAEARWFLSHSFMMLDLSKKDRLTAAQIARMLNVRDSRARFNRQTTQTFLEKLQADPALTIEQVKQVFESDSEQEASFFADASLEEAADMVAVAAHSLGYADNLAESLLQLASEEELEKYAPYLQILHYQCTLAEYFDHALTDLYEFKPRGGSALWLFGAYPEALSRAGNPFLNNAKSVERADAGWVRMKKKAERPGTAALEKILSNLEMMGFAPRRELARLIRLWLHRIIRLTEPLADLLPDSFTNAEWSKILTAVGQANTATYGILEQRTIDALSWSQYGATWRSRGIGASVNATNISNRRLGDCDYQNTDDRRVVAFESHGGSLTDIYVKEHIRTLRKSLLLRKQELEGIAEIGEWDIEITFVAHKLLLNEYENDQIIQIHGANVTLKFTTFGELIDSWQAGAPDYTVMDDLVIRPLQQKQTPIEARRKLSALVA